MNLTKLRAAQIASITPVPNKLTPAEHNELVELAGVAHAKRKHLEGVPMGTPEWHAAREDFEEASRLYAVRKCDLEGFTKRFIITLK